MLDMQAAVGRVQLRKVGSAPPAAVLFRCLIPRAHANADANAGDAVE